MTWEKLLSSTRVAELFGEPASKGDSRTEFERDYGRVLFSTPLRRMQDKTQVFPLEQHDSIRTRLTHSLEVSSVSRSLGKLVAEWLLKRKEISIAQADDIQTIAATCGLLHDIGNPPFGHSGERAIQDWFYSRIDAGEDLFAEFEKPSRVDEYKTQFVRDFLGFEGNAQTIRLLSTLQIVSYERRLVDYGLNLTCATFGSACKYLAGSHETKSRDNHAWGKPGYFASEEVVVNRLREVIESGEHRHPISYLVEACDDLVYCTGDLEDAVKKQSMTWSDLKAELLESSNQDPLVVEILKKSEEKVQYSPIERPRRDEEVTQAFRTYTMNAIKHAARDMFIAKYDDIMAGNYIHELTRDPECPTKNLLNSCQFTLRRCVYPRPEVLRIEIMGRQVLHDLMDLFWEAARECSSDHLWDADVRRFPNKILSLISRNYLLAFARGVAEKRLPETYLRLQLVTDQVSGMTDTYACTLHRRLRNH